MRQKLVESGAVDVMIDIRGNFFYTRTVPCQLWFFDRAKERDENRRDHVLMLDARNICRKVTRAIFDFSPEQQKNIAAIVWLYRGQSEPVPRLGRGLPCASSRRGASDCFAALGVRGGARQADRSGRSLRHRAARPGPVGGDVGGTPTLRRLRCRMTSRRSTPRWRRGVAVWDKTENGSNRENPTLHATREGLHDMAERCRDLTKQIDLAAKLAGRGGRHRSEGAQLAGVGLWPNTDINRARKALESARAEGVEALRRARYFVRQADWLQERFPLRRTAGCRGAGEVGGSSEIAAHDWSLAPGRYVGVAPEEEEEDFDFEEALRSIHIDLQGLNEEAAVLATRIARNFEELVA